MIRLWPPLLALLAMGVGCLLEFELFAAPNGFTVWPGNQDSMLFPGQWSLRPAGTAIELADFPVNLALSPDGKYAAVLHCGSSEHQVAIVDLAARKVTGHTRVNVAFYGITFSQDGHEIYCSGASDELVHAFSFDDGAIGSQQDVYLRDRQETGVPAGVALDAAGKTLYVANFWSGRLTRVVLDVQTILDIDLSTTAVPLPPAPMESFDTSADTKPVRAAEPAARKYLNGVFPYACVLDQKGGRIYVSLWGAATVAVVDLKKAKVAARWPVGEHPCEMAMSRDGKRLFVANANDNTVTVLDTRTGRATETLSAAPYPNSPRGATQTSLALSPDEKTLFVANANINAVAVFDVSNVAHGRCLGFIPSGWYPTCVRVTPDGRQLLIVNGKGSSALPAHETVKRKPSPVGGLYHGSLNIVDLPSATGFAQQMAVWTADVLKCTPSLETGAPISPPAR